MSVENIILLIIFGGVVVIGLLGIFALAITSMILDYKREVREKDE